MGAAVELRLQRADGTWVDVHLASQTDFDARGCLFECRTTVADITERRRVEARLQESETLSRTLFDRTTNPIFVIDESGRIVDFNVAAERHMGLDSDRLRGRSISDFFRSPSADGPGLLRALHEERAPLEVECYAGEHIKVMELSVTPVTRDGRRMIVALGTDITGRKVVESKLRHEVLHDSLTQLPNRRRLQQALDSAVKRRRQDPSSEFAVLFLDVDRFKEINDEWGHLLGDRILVEIAARLRACVREKDLVVRFGGDEFVVLVDDLRGGRDEALAARRILDAMRTPFRLGGTEVTMGVSIGLALSSACPAADADAILREADSAMYRAKAGGRGRYECAHDSLRESDSATNA